jgi:hypothetical protein
MSWGGFFRSILGLPGVTPVVKHLIPLPGDTLSPEDQQTEQRIQQVLDTDPELIAAKQRGASADELEGLLRGKGLPMGGSAWRLRESTSTSSGFRPTLAMSKKRGAAYTAAGVAGGVGGAAAAGGFAGAGGGAGGAAAGGVAGGAGGAGTAATGGVLASHAIAPAVGSIAPGVAASGSVPAAFGAGGAVAGGSGMMGMFRNGGIFGRGGGGPGGTATAGQTTAARIAQSGISAIVSGVMAKRAQDQAMQRSPEEQAALAGSNKIAGQLSGTGSDLISQGAGNTAGAAQYFSTLLHGSRAQMAQATAGPRGAITDTYAGAQRGLERSGVRGAERDVAQGELQRQGAGQISALTTGVQPAAADALQAIGSGQTSAGAGMFGAAGSIYQNLLGAANANRRYARSEGQDAGSIWGNLAGSMLSAYLGGGR